MIPLTDRQLQDFQEILNWETGMRLPDGRVLGKAREHYFISEGNDNLAAYVARHLSPQDKTILEIGSCEGIHTIQLARICRKVVALEVRPKNVACTLVRLFVHDVHNVELHLKDVRDLQPDFGSFDIIFHAGVLYHLSDPVQHLFRIGALGKILLLDTHYVLDSCSPAADIDWKGKRYKASFVPEGGWNDMWSGVEPTSRWLHRDALLAAVQDAGFESVEVLSDRVERCGNRLTLVARKKVAQFDRNSCKRPVGENLVARVETLERELAGLRRTADQLSREVTRARSISTGALQDLTHARGALQGLNEQVAGMRRSWT